MGPSSSAQVPTMPGSFQLQSPSFPIPDVFLWVGHGGMTDPSEPVDTAPSDKGYDVPCSVEADSLLTQGLQSTRLLCPWFSRQEFWSGLPFPPLGELPDPGIEPESPALQADSLPSEPWGKSQTRSTRSSNNGCPLLGGRSSRDFRPCKHPRH